MEEILLCLFRRESNYKSAMVRRQKIRYLVGVVLLFLTVAADAFAQLDSTVRAALDERLSEYFAAIEFEGPETQKGECDFLIDTCVDSLMRQHVALSAYEHYRDSKVMGAEAVAIHVFDKWFDSGKVKMRDENELLAARIFAEFNRRSLIGNQAPEMTLFDLDGDPITLFDEPSDRFAVLYFYDTSCSTCRMQSILLRHLFREEDFPVDFIAVYASDNEEEWRDYAFGKLKFDARMVRVHHMWDPAMDSDFQRKYGVIQTPRMFLIAPDGTIVGRGLDVRALGVMLHDIFDEVELEYGNDESIALYDSLFGDGPISAKEVNDVSNYIETNTLPKGDTVMFKQMTGDLMYYLSIRSGEGFKEGMARLVKEKILSRPDVWKTSDDSLKVVGMAQMYDGLLSKAAPGTLVPDLKVPGTLLSWKKTRTGEFRLRRLGGRENYIMFVTDGCNVCAAQKEAAARLVADNRKTKVLIVNVDEVLAADPDLSVKLFNDFDLSTLPFVIKTGRNARIYRRYILDL